jgi:SAM-dependent methyltransferase
VNREQIEWCSEVITPVFPNFEFAHVDVANSTYNEKGAVGGSEFRFPYADESFDLVFMTSIVTHMLPATVERYLAETTRVLKGGGRALITWFLLNVEQRYYMQTFGKHGFTFQGAGEEGVYAVQNPERPEDVVAYEDVWVKQAYLDAGLVMKEPIRFGSWSGRPRPVSYQDIVVSRKEV